MGAQPTSPTTEFDAVRIGGYWCWQGTVESVAYAFVGRGPRVETGGVLRALGEPSLPTAWLQQVHSIDLREAVRGDSGRGDALHSTALDLALVIQTADCVPVLLASETRVAAIHAGWRGIEAGVVPVSLQQLAPAQDLTAILGPSIGPCCYEVGEEVAQAVEKNLPTSDAIRRFPGTKPHIDLQLAVAQQLEAAGIRVLQQVRACTRCNPDLLWSHRRDGPRAGRNLAFIWRR